MKTIPSILALVTALSLTSLSAHAVTEMDASTDGSETAYDGNIQSNDLLTDATITTNGVAPDYGSSYTGLNDGLVSNGGGNAPNNLFLNHSVTGTPALDESPVVTFTLDTSVATGSPLGYSLTSINSIYGWQNFASFSDQSYTVSYSTVADPSAFTLLATVDYAPFDPSNGDTQSSQVTLTNLTGAVGVGTIQFAFTPYVSETDGEQSGQMIREIDVDGTPTLASPEPSAWTLIGVGVLILAWRLRRGQFSV